MPGKPIHVRVARRLKAPAHRVYEIIADYHHGHPLILPARAFEGLMVERGGRGDGTVIRFGMRAFGKTTWVRAAIEEPEPGRVLVERTQDGTGLVTSFTVEPDGEDHAMVTLDTKWTPRGLRAWFERLVAPPFLKSLYMEELGNLEKVATGAL